MSDERIQRIPLNLDCHPAERFGAVHLTQGVPFADGALARGTPARVVDAEGNACPTQCTPLATWDPAGERVRWLLVDAQLPGGASGEMDLALEFGPDAEPPALANPVTVRRDGRTRIISNGLVEIALRSGSRQFISELRVRTDDGWRDLLAGGAELYMIDAKGNRYDTATAAPPPTVRIEEEGPLRTSACIRGYHANADGLRFCPFVLRIHVLAGRRDVKMFHTFIFDQDPDLVELSAVGMRLGLKLGDAQRVAFGGDERNHFAANLYGAPEVWSEACWTQLSDREYGVTLDGGAFGGGERADGWATLAGDRGGVGVTLRDAWREYPKAIAVRPDELDVQFWPESAGRTLAFKTPWREPVIRAKYEDELWEKLAANQTAGVQWKGFLGSGDVPPDAKEGDMTTMREALEFSRKHLRDRLVSFGDTACGKAAGVAKTHEFSLHLTADGLDDETAADWAAGVQTPAIAPPPAGHLCATKVLRLLTPKDPGIRPDVERELDHMLDALLLGPVEEDRLYGAIDYGDFVNCHVRAHGWLYRLVRDDPTIKFTDIGGWFNNESTDLGLTLWQYYFRSPSRELWRAADAYCEHTGDVDIIHAHPTQPGAVGRINYHSMLHWSGPSPSHTHCTNLLLHYYLTGNRRSFDIAGEVADAALRNQEPCGVYSNRGGVLRREFTVPMAQLWHYYEATWQQRYLDCARRSLDFFVSCQDPSGMWARDVFTSGERGDVPRLDGDVTPGATNEGIHALYDAWRITGDERYRDSLAAAADFYLTWADRPGVTVPALYQGMVTPGATVSFAWELTGERKYLDAIATALDEAPEAMRGWAEMELKTPFQRALDVPQSVHAMLAAEARSRIRS